MILGDEPLEPIQRRTRGAEASKGDEALDESPGVDVVLDATVKLAEKVGLPPFLDLFRRALKLGQPSVEKMVDDLESAAYEEIRRIWEHLEGQVERQKEFETRLNSHEAQVAYLSACFHGLRTSDPQKHSRLAFLTINCIFMDDLKPETLDNMMRAAVELKDADIVLLERIYKIQVHIIREVTGTDNDRLHRIVTDWTARTKLRIENGGIELGSCRGSLARLQAQAFIQLRTPGFDAGAEIAVLLEDGAKFYERLQEIAIQQ
jgi:hypothetical protein